jgi:hypothetical protein
MFIWRACKNIIPTKDNLYSRKVVNEKPCPISGRETESFGHILWTYPSAQDVWRSGLRKFQKGASMEDNFSHLLFTTLTRCDPEEVDLWAIIARKIWFRRNKVVHGGEFTDPTIVIQEATRLLHDFNRSNTREEESPRNNNDHEGIYWQPPLSGTIKINWDAGLDKANGKVGLGMIARDFKGLVLGARSLTIACIADPTTDEAIAALYATNFCKELGFFF